MDRLNEGLIEQVANLKRELGVLRANEQVVNATATPTANRIPIADANAKLDGWVSRWIYPNDPAWVGTAGAPLNSTAWDGDSFSTTAKTLIDLSAVFGAPAGVKAVLVTGYIRDSASATTDCWLILGPTSSDFVGMGITCPSVNDRPNRYTSIIPCDSNGDIYYQIGASGASTLDIFLQIWGYYL